MPPKVISILLCDSAHAQGGKVTLYGVFDRIFATRFPALHQACSIVTEIEGDPDTDATVRLRYVDSDESDVFPPVTMNAKMSAFGACRMIANVQGLPLTREGFFAVIVESEGQEIGRRNLYVEQVREGGPHV